MSNSISTLLLRNLSDVFGEGDPLRRRAALEELWNEDGVFYDPNKGVYRGHDEIDRIAGALRVTHHDSVISQSPSPRNWARRTRHRVSASGAGAGLQRDRFPHRPRRSDRRSLSLFRQTAVS